MQANWASSINEIVVRFRLRWNLCNLTLLYRLHGGPRKFQGPPNFPPRRLRRTTVPSPGNINYARPSSEHVASRAQLRKPFVVPRHRPACLYLPSPARAVLLLNSESLAMNILTHTRDRLPPGRLHPQITNRFEQSVPGDEFRYKSAGKKRDLEICAVQDNGRIASSISDGARDAAELRTRKLRFSFHRIF